MKHSVPKRHYHRLTDATQRLCFQYDRYGLQRHHVPLILDLVHHDQSLSDNSQDELVVVNPAMIDSCAPKSLYV